MDSDDDIVLFKTKEVDGDVEDDDVFGIKAKTKNHASNGGNDEDDLFGMKNKATRHGSKQEEGTENLTNSYDFMLTGHTNRDSFPSMAADFTFNHGGVDVLPDMMPAMTHKTKLKARKSSGEYDEDKLAFVIEHWNKKTSLKRKKVVNSKEVNEISMNSLTLGASDKPLKAVNKWKTLRRKDM